MKKSLLIVDDDIYILNLLKNYFTREGYTVHSLTKGKPVLRHLNENTVSAVLCDVRLPDINGVDLLSDIRRAYPELPVIMMTAYAGIRSAVDTIRSGAYDYVTKPIFPEEISELLKKAIAGKEKPQSTVDSDFITGESQAMLEVIDQSKLVAPTDMTVLIQGETGSGKEYIARLIHQHSKRKDKNFVAIDCGAIPHELAASELFGHVKGAFTGAISDKTGYFSEANGGTIFLDEIGNLSYETQVKLLRAIQQKVITRVGDSKTLPVDVRIIAATNRDLMQAVDEGEFREDLYHRLNEFKVQLPPVRNRGNDVLIFARHFLSEANRDLNKSVQGFDKGVEDAFLKYTWYGNLRELRNVVKRGVLIATGDQVTLGCLPDEVRNPEALTLTTSDEQGTAVAIENMDLKDAAREAERLVIERALREANFNKSQAAKMLNIDRKTLYNKLEQFGLDK